MFIREMSRDECLRVLAAARLDRLACASNNQPYVVPIDFAYHEPSVGGPRLYGYTTLGQKVEWMRANPRVCVEVDEVISATQWTSVILFGRYEELPDVPLREERYGPLRRSDNHIVELLPEEPAPAGERLLAHRLLQSCAVWWEPASTARTARAHRGATETLTPILYKISIDRVTGRQATTDVRSTSESVPPHASRPGWLCSMLTKILGNRRKCVDSGASGPVIRGNADDVNANRPSV